MTAGAASEKATPFNFGHVGANLSGIDEVGHSTCRAAGEAQQVTALNIQVDIDEHRQVIGRRTFHRRGGVDESPRPLLLLRAAPRRILFKVHADT